MAQLAEDGVAHRRIVLRSPECLQRRNQPLLLGDEVLFGRLQILRVGLRAPGIRLFAHDHLPDEASQKLHEERGALERLAVHYHDTYGQALANIYASLEAGVATIDGSGPTLLTGYGGFEIPRVAAYSAVIGQSWLSAGGPCDR